jgi:hypothetical protein
VEVDEDLGLSSRKRSIAMSPPQHVCLLSVSVQICSRGSPLSPFFANLQVSIGRSKPSYPGVVTMDLVVVDRLGGDAKLYGRR